MRYLNSWFIAAMVATTASLVAQPDLPRIGDEVWARTSYRPTSGGYTNATSTMIVKDRNEVVVSSNTMYLDSNNFRSYKGELVVMDFETGEVIREIGLPCIAVYRDTVFEKGWYTVLGANMDNAGTILCYKCHGLPVSIVQWPSLEPLLDHGIDLSCQYCGVTVSKNGRYFFANGSDYVLRRIDRTTRDSVAIGFPIMQMDDSGHVGVSEGHVRLGNIDTERPFLVDLNTGEQRGSLLGIGGFDCRYALSRDGSKILVATYEYKGGPGGRGYIAVYDTRSGEVIWVIENQTQSDVNQPVSISPDGSHVYILDTVKSPTQDWLRYDLPSKSPVAYTYLMCLDPQMPFNDEFINPSGILDRKGGGGVVRKIRYTMPSSIQEDNENNVQVVHEEGSDVYRIKVPDCGVGLWNVELFDLNGRSVQRSFESCMANEVRVSYTMIFSGRYAVRLTQQNRAAVFTALITFP